MKRRSDDGVPRNTYCRNRVQPCRTDDGQLGTLGRCMKTTVLILLSYYNRTGWTKRPPSTMTRRQSGCTDTTTTVTTARNSYHLFSRSTPSASNETTNADGQQTTEYVPILCVNSSSRQATGACTDGTGSTSSKCHALPRWQTTTETGVMTSRRRRLFPAMIILKMRLKTCLVRRVSRNEIGDAVHNGRLV